LTIIIRNNNKEELKIVHNNQTEKMKILNSHLDHGNMDKAKGLPRLDPGQRKRRNRLQSGPGNELSVHSHQDLINRD
jgi:hypothetical protein